MLNKGDLLIGNGTEISSFREVVTDEAIGVLVGSPLPRVVRMSKVRSASGSALKLLPASILRSVVEGDGAFGLGRERSESVSDRCPCCRARFVLKLGDVYQPRLPFHERVDAGGVISRFNGIALPVPDAGTVIDCAGAVIDGGNGKPSQSSAFPRSFLQSALSPSAQIQPQILMARPEETPAISVDLGVDVLVYGFVGDGLVQIMPDTPRNLFGRPSALQMRDDIGTDTIVLEPFCSAAVRAVLHGPFLRKAGRISFMDGREVPFHFPQYRGVGSPHASCNGPQ